MSESTQTNQEFVKITISTMRSAIDQWSAVVEKFNPLLADNNVFRFAIVDNHSRLLFTEDGYDPGPTDSANKNEITKPRLENPSLNTNVVNAFSLGNSLFSEMKAKQISDVCVDMLGTDAGPYKVIDVHQYAQNEVVYCESIVAKLLMAKWKQNDIDKIESFTMNDGKEIVAALLNEFNISPEKWEPSKESISPWEYMRLDLDGQKISIGVSSGGVVSVGGRSHAPDDLACNITLDSVRRSLRNEIKEFIHVVIAKVDSAAFIDIGRSQETARIFRELADSVRKMDTLHGIHIPLKDVNGNEVGVVSHSYDHHPKQECHANLTIRVHHLSNNEVANIIEEAGSYIQDGLNHRYILKSDNDIVNGVLFFNDWAVVDPQVLESDNSQSLHTPQ